MSYRQNVKRQELSPRARMLLQRRRQRLYKDRNIQPGRIEESGPMPSLTLAAKAVVQQVSDSHTKPYISITVLGKVTMTLHAIDGSTFDVPLNLNPKTMQLVAYLAWKRGIAVKRETLIDDIWDTGMGSTPKRLGWAFESSRKVIRKTILGAAEEWNEARGQLMFDLRDFQLDIFIHKNQLWQLSPACKVFDLDTVEEQHRIIMTAENRGDLVNTVPDRVKLACDSLIDAYHGDYLEDLIRLYPVEKTTWADSWIRDPITMYRDYYLRAIWYAAEYERAAGLRITNDHAASDSELWMKQGECWKRSAVLYRKYAMYACNNELDTKVYFDLAGRGDGERVVWSERALRKCIMLSSKLGDPYLIEEIFSTYYDQMRAISYENWEPSEDTLRAVKEARERAASQRTE